MTKKPFILALAAAGLWWLWRQKRPAAPSFTTARPGEFALITGASSGFGAEFARALARLGYRLILTGRRVNRLEAVAASLRSEFHAVVEVMPGDLADPQAVRALCEAVRNTPNLAVLVNNAGRGLSRRFYKEDPAELRAVIDLHVQASVQLARAALPGMVARGRGAVINVASVAAFAPVVGLTTYGATKRYLVFFSEALAGELANSGVRVQALCPGYTRTEIIQTMQMRPEDVRRIPAFLWQQTGPIVAGSLAALERGQVVYVPGPFYQLAAASLQMPVLSALIWKVYNRLASSPF